MFAGFSVPENRWHKFVGQVNGIKASIYPTRADDGKPNSWEIKSADFLTVKSWQRAKARKLCFELARSLHANGCFVYSISLDKGKLTDPPVEEKFVPLMLQRLIFTFHDQVANHENTGSIVLDASTHEMDHAIPQILLFDEHENNEHDDHCGRADGIRQIERIAQVRRKLRRGRAGLELIEATDSGVAVGIRDENEGRASG